MGERNRRIVDGYRFGSDREAELAQAEADKVRFLEERMQYDNPGTVLAIYQKAIDNRVFETQVGMEYLRKLQLYLKEQNFSDSIREIPVYPRENTETGRMRENLSLRSSLKQAEENRRINRRRLRISVLINIGLLALVLSMFVITLSSDNPNILNYQRVLENKYAAWEQELNDREQEIRQLEKEHTISQF